MDLDYRALLQHDSNGLYPLHHLITMAHRNECILSNEMNVLDTIEYMVQTYPFVLDSSFECHDENDDNKDQSSQQQQKQQQTSSPSPSPLIHLLSQKSNIQSTATTSPTLTNIMTNNENENTSSSNTSSSSVMKCATLLLKSNPKLIHTKSIMTSCTPLHMALRNNYGNCLELLQLLLKIDDEEYNNNNNGGGSGCSREVMMRMMNCRNTFGDLPVVVVSRCFLCRFPCRFQKENKTIPK